MRNPSAAVALGLACGVAVLDVQQTVDRLPRPDEELVARDLPVASRALGVGAALVTGIGDSAPGILFRSDLAGHGVMVVDLAVPWAAAARPQA